MKTYSPEKIIIIFQKHTAIILNKQHLHQQRGGSTLMCSGIELYWDASNKTVFNTAILVTAI